MSNCCNDFHKQCIKPSDFIYKSPKSNVGVCVFDIDSTLIHRGKPLKNSKKAIKKCKSNGMKLAINTLESS